MTECNVWSGSGFRNRQTCNLTCAELCRGVVSTAGATACDTLFIPSENSAGGLHSCRNLQVGLCLINQSFLDHRSDLMQDSYPIRAAPACCEPGFLARQAALQAAIRYNRAIMGLGCDCAVDLHCLRSDKQRRRKTGTVNTQPLRNQWLTPV